MVHNENAKPNRLVRRNSLDAKSDFFTSGGVMGIVKKMQNPVESAEKNQKFVLLGADDIAESMEALGIEDATSSLSSSNASTVSIQSVFKTEPPCIPVQKTSSQPPIVAPAPVYASQETRTAYPIVQSLPCDFRAPQSMEYPSFHNQDRCEEMCIRYGGIDLGCGDASPDLFLPTPSSYSNMRRPSESDCSWVSDSASVVSCESSCNTVSLLRSASSVSDFSSTSASQSVRIHTEAELRSEVRWIRHTEAEMLSEVRSWNVGCMPTWRM
eukprot:CAMPEP_0113661668 /NCGR_PEP_ID=MMETSP0038_2-20120614/104_1 /TAXON_ID=2898 /ORGANISM="Cryptomonas paramecium" /LENGTH=268 /DNA_ID=CAMNT_0000576389 /DNA_START=26 /DNA_END=832 /DNA_ORIENTATION=- /assembly_acc=CAM_ASM_000170